MKLFAAVLLVAAGCSYESSLGGRNAPRGVDAADGLQVDAAEHDASPFDAQSFAWEGATAIGTTPFVGSLGFVHGDQIWAHENHALYTIDKTTAAYSVVATDAGTGFASSALSADDVGMAYATPNGTIAVRAWDGTSIELSTPGEVYAWAAVGGDYVFALSKARLDRFPRAGGAPTTIAVSPSPANCMLFGPIALDADAVYTSALYGAASDGCPVEVGPRNWFFQRVPRTATGITAATPVPFDSETLLAAGGDRVYGTRQIVVYAPSDGSGRTTAMTGHTWPTQSNVFELAIHGNFVYWTAQREPPGDDAQTEVGCAPLDAGGATIVSRGPGGAMGLAIDDDAVYWRTGCPTNVTTCPSMTLWKAPSCH